MRTAVIISVICTSFICAQPTTPKFAAAVARTAAGVSNTVVLGIGDSTMEGVPLQETSSWLANTQITGTVPNAAGLSIYGIGAGGLDSRWSPLASGWGITSNAGLAYSGMFAGPGADPMTFTPVGTFDTYRIYYTALSGLGGFTVGATGGSPVTVNSNVGTGSIASVVVTAPAGTNTVTFSTITGGGAIIVAVLPTLSATPKITIGNLGDASSSASQWAAGGLIKSIAAILAATPDLCILDLGINDTEDVLIFVGYMQAIINACEVSGDVVLKTFWPSDPSTVSAAQEALYYPALLALAETNNLPVLDIYGSFGGVYQPSMSYDTRHPNLFGYENETSKASPFLTALAQPVYMATVPNVVGLTQSSATSAIISAGLILGTVTTAPSSTIAAGLVISETPSAGTSVSVGSAVSLVVSTGPASPPPSSVTFSCPSLSETFTTPGTFSIPIECTLTKN